MQSVSWVRSPPAARKICWSELASLRVICRNDMIQCAVLRIGTLTGGPLCRDSHPPVFLFRQFWGRNSAPFPMAKHHHFSQLTQKNSQSKIKKKSELVSSFLIATKTNDYYIFTFVEVNTVSNCSLTSSDIKSNVFET